MTDEQYAEWQNEHPVARIWGTHPEDWVCCACGKKEKFFIGVNGMVAVKCKRPLCLDCWEKEHPTESRAFRDRKMNELNRFFGKMGIKSNF